MISINPINFFPRSSFRLQNKPAESVPETTKNIAAEFLRQASSRFVDTGLLNQLPKGLVTETTHILRRINNRALEAAELGQLFSNRQALQDSITEDLADLKTALDQYSQDDLKLFTALFQNQLVVGPVNNNTNQNSFNSDFFLNGTVENFSKNLFRIDVTSDAGILAALNLTDSIINIFSPSNSSPRLLESLLSNLTDYSFNISGINRVRRDPDSTAIKDSSGISRLLAQTLNVYPFMSNAKAPTIIDLVG